MANRWGNNGTSKRLSFSGLQITADGDCRKDWCWSWNSNTLATWCEELTHWKRPWCWERLKEGGKGDYRGWDGWMASPTPWTWVWVSSGSWWCIGKPDVLQSVGLQRVGCDWETELKSDWKLLISSDEFLHKKIFLIKYWCRDKFNVTQSWLKTVTSSPNQLVRMSTRDSFGLPTCGYSPNSFQAWASRMMVTTFTH